MKVTLGTFARSGIESELGTDLTAAVQAALFHYAGKLRAGRAPIAPPAFLGASAGVSRDEGAVLELSLDPELEALLEREAARQGTDLAALAVHSVQVYLAELDFLRAPSTRMV